MLVVTVGTSSLYVYDPAVSCVGNDADAEVTLQNQR